MYLRPISRILSSVNPPFAGFFQRRRPPKKSVKDETSVLEITNRKIIRTTDEEVAKSDKVIALIDATASVMETTHDHVQNLAASTEETAAAMENVATGSQEVSETAEELKRMTERFRVEKDEDRSNFGEGAGFGKLALAAH